MTFQEIIAKIGKGQKGARDLTGEEAAFAVTHLLENKASPYQVGAFLIALRIKEETPEELLIFARHCQKSLHPLLSQLNTDPSETLDLPYYAGKKHSFHAGIAASIVMAAAGLKVVSHGDPTPPGRTSKSMVLAQLGWEPRLPLKQRIDFFGETGWTYLDISQIHPHIKGFLDSRNEIGLRSVFHTLARFLNPAGAANQIIGVSHPKSFHKIGEAVQGLGASRALIIRGLEGESEAPLSGPVEGVCLGQGSLSKIQLDPAPLGLAPVRRSEIEIRDVPSEARTVEHILDGCEGKDKTALVLWNASIGLYVSGKAATLEKGYQRSKESLESGKALSLLKKIQKSTEHLSGE
jgi:anthranilate phosphoribosyltransferase